MRTKYKAWTKPYLEEHKEVQIDIPSLAALTTPYYLEIGSGKGQFILNMAKNNPDKLFIGVERNQTCAGFTAKKLVDEKIENAKIMWENADRILMDLPDDIVDVISQYVVLKRSGRNFFGLCPFHKEKSPSFSVSPDKQIFHCFGCGLGGDVFRFVSQIENIPFREAVEMLAERVGVEVPKSDSEGDSETLKLKSRVYEINQIVADYYHENLYKPTAKVAQEYVKKRKLDNATLKNFLIGYSDSNNGLYKI